MIIELLLAEEAVETGWIEKVFTNPWYTGLGTLASLLGILVTFIQVTRTRRTSSLVKKEVVSAKLKIKAFLDIASVTKISSEIELTRENIRKDAYDAACVRLSELKRFLCEYKSKAPQKNVVEIKELITKLGLDLILLENIQNEKDIDKKSLLSHLNKMSDLISDWSGELKNKTYEENGNRK